MSRTFWAGHAVSGGRGPRSALYPLRRADVIELAILFVVAAGLRGLAAWALGDGAPFGPDGTGAEAAVHLGGHLYPLHPLLIGVVGSARSLSVLSGGVVCAALGLLGKRSGLGGAAGWIAAMHPLLVYTGALSAGDAPALALVCAGAALATVGAAGTRAPVRPDGAASGLRATASAAKLTPGPQGSDGVMPVESRIWALDHAAHWGRVWAAPLLGGALAGLSVWVKPIALPAALLLCLRPRALVGFAAVLLVAHRWLDPLLRPRPTGGLLGSWWASTSGAPPMELGPWLSGGVAAIAAAPLWTLWPLALLAPVSALLPVPSFTTLRHRFRRLNGAEAAEPAPARCADAPVLLRACALLAPLGLLGLGALFGPRLEPRYLAPLLAAALPWLGRRWPLGLEGLGLWISAALVTQVAAFRAEADPAAGVPTLPVLSLPRVDARALFDESSTADATSLRAEGLRLAETVPWGGTVTVERRPHGREGELVWPLRVRRPDVQIRRR